MVRSSGYLLAGQMKRLHNGQKEWWGPLPPPQLAFRLPICRLTDSHLLGCLKLESQRLCFSFVSSSSCLLFLIHQGCPSNSAIHAYPSVTPIQSCPMSISTVVPELHQQRTDSYSCVLLDSVVEKLHDCWGESPSTCVVSLPAFA